LRYNQKPQLRDYSTGKRGFLKRSCSIKALSIHIKGAIGGKVKPRPEETAGRAAQNQLDPAFPILPDVLRCLPDFPD